MRQRRLMAFAGVVLAVLVPAGCGGGSDVTDREIVLDIQPQGTEGTSGTFSISKSGDSTSVIVEALVPSGGGQQGAGFYKGTCEDFDQSTGLDVGPLEEGYGALTLDHPIEDLLDGGYVLIVTKSPEDKAVIGCGPVNVE